MTRNLPPQSNSTRWDRVPQGVIYAYEAAVSQLYSGALPVEEIKEREAEIYNAYFGIYGLLKPGKYLYN